MLLAWSGPDKVGAGRGGEGSGGGGGGREVTNRRTGPEETDP